MGKKPASKKKPAKAAPKPGATKSAKGSPTPRKPTAKPAAKPAAGKAPSKKAATPKAPAKKPTKAAPDKKPGAKQPDKKPADKKPADKKATTSPAPKAESKPAKPTKGDKAPDHKAGSSKAPAAKTAADTKADAKAGDDKKAGRKGITIVSDKPARKPRAASPVSKFPPPGPRLLGPGSPLRRPLIVSGPQAPRRPTDADNASTKKRKTPFNKKQLDAYRAILLAKRSELIGDVQAMETDALRSSSGGLSNTPQHLAEQGSDSADQSLNLNLAAADRRLIKEIDAALARIADKTYGLCEMTGEPISEERLEELPWARLSIEAARQLESRGGVS